MNLVPSRRDMPSARRRAVTSADEPAGNRTVISMTPRGRAASPLGRPASCAVAAVATLRSAQTAAAATLAVFMASPFSCSINQSIALEYLRDLHAPSLLCRADAGPDDGERSGAVIAADLGLAVAAHRGR